MFSFFPLFSLMPDVLHKLTKSANVTGHNSLSVMGYSTLVPGSSKTVSKNYQFTAKKYLQPNKRGRQYAHKVKVSSREILKSVYSARGHSSRAIETIVSSW